MHTSNAGTKSDLDQRQRLQSTLEVARRYACSRQDVPVRLPVSLIKEQQDAHVVCRHVQLVLLVTPLHFDICRQAMLQLHGLVGEARTSTAATLDIMLWRGRHAGFACYTKLAQPAA